MSSTIDRDELRDAIEKLETCFVEPVVSGELETWLRTAVNISEAFGAALRRQIERIHATQLAQIGREDAELLPKVQRLQEEDRGLLEEYETVHRELQRLAERANKLEPDEGRLEQERAKLADRGIAFIIRVRKQEAEVATWHAEAFHRDRGVVD